MKKIIFSITLSLIAAVYFSSSYWMPARIAGIYQSEDRMQVSDIKFKSTVVLIDNPPFTKEGIKKLWVKSNKFVLEGRNVMLEKYDKIVFIKNNLIRPYNSQELRYWEGDNQFCLRGSLGDKCLSKDDVFFVIVSNETGGGYDDISDYNGINYSIIFVNR
ncbi:hypothetical protein ABEI22_13245 [Erwinia billingiae]|uniref:hypothetical protein n=1 Tax=Erwinia billingiae TaxID=182337 RepID=UPI00320A2012